MGLRKHRSLLWRFEQHHGGYLPSHKPGEEKRHSSTALRSVSRCRTNHLYTLAFPKEPLVAKFGVISQPPSVTIDLTTVDDVYADFDIVARGLGCNYGNDAEAELECMRQVSWVQIEEYINRYNATPSIAFSNYIRGCRDDHTHE